MTSSDRRIFVRQKRTENGENENLPRILYGVRKRGDLLYFAVSVPEAKECILKLYRDNEQIFIVHMTERIGTLFFTVVNNQALQADSYQYEANGIEFTDPCAGRIIGREEFGAVLEDGSLPSTKGGFISEPFDWEEDVALKHTFSELVIYKLHIRGFTKQENSGVKHKGTYLGVIEKLSYLKELGINAVLLMPCMEFDEFFEEENGSEGKYAGDIRFYNRVCSQEKKRERPNRINYWGYAEKNFYFAPKASFASCPKQAPYEFCKMVKTLHQANIEVYMEINFTKKISQDQMLEILRYWVIMYHIDGFRIDTSILFDELAARDPVLGKTKLFSAGWKEELIGQDHLAEYNDVFLREVRKFLKGDEGKVGSFADRFRYCGRADATINYLADHNGFNLQDMYTFDVKHNETNGEQNRDGMEFNDSWNCGIEGKTKKKKINELRLRMKKNAVAALLFSQGTPMILAGDEFGNSQDGNNNVYCQDNPIGWTDWKALKSNQGFLQFVKELILIRKEHPVFHNQNRLRGMDYHSFGCPDISFHGTKAWYPDFSNYNRTLGILLFGKYAQKENGDEDNSFYLIFNMHWEAHRFDLPSIGGNNEWKLLKSSDPIANQDMIEEKSKQRTYLAGPRSFSIFINI